MKPESKATFSWKNDRMIPSADNGNIQQLTSLLCEPRFVCRSAIVREFQFTQNVRGRVFWKVFLGKTNVLGKKSCSFQGVNTCGIMARHLNITVGLKVVLHSVLVKKNTRSWNRRFCSDSADQKNPHDSCWPAGKFVWVGTNRHRMNRHSSFPSAFWKFSVEKMKMPAGLSSRRDWLAHEVVGDSKHCESLWVSEPSGVQRNHHQSFGHI